MCSLRSAPCPAPTFGEQPCTPPCRAPFVIPASQEALESTTLEVLRTTCFLGTHAFHLYNAIAAKLGIEVEPLYANKGVKGVISQYVKQVDAAVGIYPRCFPYEQVAFDPAKLPAAFHPFAEFCCHCGRQPCARLQGGALDAALATARAKEAATPLPPPPLPPPAEPSPRAWAKSVHDAGVLRRLLESPCADDVLEAERLSSSCCISHILWKLVASCILWRACSSYDVRVPVATRGERAGG